MSTYVDTAGLYALLDAADECHTLAVDAWRGLVDRPEELTSTNYVVVEALSLVQARLGLAAVRILVRDVVPVLHVHWIDPATHDAALAALLTAARRHLSLVDCVSFETMRRLEIRRVFTFDRHFAEQGFEVVP